MGDLDKNIRRREEPSPYEKIIVNPIEKDKREREEGYTGLKNSTRTQVFATLVSFFKRILTVVSSKGKGHLYFYDQQHLLDNVVAFRQLLVILSGTIKAITPILPSN